MKESESLIVKPWKTNDSGTLAVAIPKPIREKLDLPEDVRFSISISDQKEITLKPVKLRTEPLNK